MTSSDSSVTMTTEGPRTSRMPSGPRSVMPTGLKQARQLSSQIIKAAVHALTKQPFLHKPTMLSQRQHPQIWTVFCCHSLLPKVAQSPYPWASKARWVSLCPTGNYVKLGITSLLSDILHRRQIIMLRALSRSEHDRSQRRGHHNTRFHFRNARLLRREVIFRPTWDYYCRTHRINIFSKDTDCKFQL